MNITSFHLWECEKQLRKSQIMCHNYQDLITNQVLSFLKRALIQDVSILHFDAMRAQGVICCSNNAVYVIVFKDKNLNAPGRKMVNDNGI